MSRVVIVPFVRLALVGILLVLAGAPTGVIAQGATSVAGQVRFADGAPLVYADVVARRFDAPGTASTISDLAGNFTLSLAPGLWQVEVVTLSSTAQWMSIDAPATLTVTATPPAPLSLVVERTTTQLVGRVLGDDNTPLPLAPSAPAPTVEVWSDDHYGARSTPIDATGAFTLPLVSGRYNLVLNLDAAFYANYDVPLPVVTEVPADGVVSVGEIIVPLRNAVIEGIVEQQGVGGLPGVQVYAVGEDGGYSETVSASGGTFSMAVPAGIWDVIAIPSGSGAYVSGDSVVSAEAAPGAPANVTLTLVPAARQIQGSLVGPGGSVASDLEGWAYAREANSDEIVAYTDVSGGVFSLNVPAGSLRVGVLLPADSPYSLVADETQPLARLAAGALSGRQQEAAERAPYERSLTVRPLGEGALELAQTTVVTLSVTSNNRLITGVVRDPSGAALPDLPLLVTASPEQPGAAPQSAPVGANGAYQLSVSPGLWRLNYSFGAAAEGLARSLTTPISVTVGAASPITQDLALLRLDGVISGTVIDEQGRPLADQRIWVEAAIYSDETRTASDGSFSLPVPLVAGRPTGYVLGIDATCPNDASCLLDLAPQLVMAQPRPGAGSLGLAQLGTQIYRVRGSNSGRTVTITGKVTSNGSGVDDADVEPDIRGSKRSSDDETEGGGNFRIQASFNNQVTEIFGAIEVSKGRAKGTYNLGRQTVTSAMTLQQTTAINVGEIAIEPLADLPPSVVDSFVAAEGWSFTLDDGTGIRIPPGAVVLPPDAGGEVRVVVEPILKLPVDPQYTWAVPYGYNITLFAKATGLAISAPLSAPAELTLRYTQANLTAYLATPARLRPARLVDGSWSAADSFSLDQGRARVVVQTSSLGTWAIVQQRGACPGCWYLPIIRTKSYGR